MQITKLVKFQSKKILVYINDEFAFFLYPSEIRKCGIVENTGIDEAEYERILSEIVLRRGKQKALSLLEKMDRTEWELRRKLKQLMYTESQIDTIVEYIKGYHYIDDRRYTEYYIRSHKGKQSVRMMFEKLRQKGVSQDVIQKELDNLEVDEEEAICSLIRKKCKNSDEMTYEEKQKLRSFLYRRGFSTDLISRHVQ